MGKFFHSTLLQFTQLYEYLAIDSGGYVYEQRSVRKVNCKSALSSPEEGILHYIRTYLSISFYCNFKDNTYTIEHIHVSKIR